jgi:carbon storage regulator
MNGEGRRGGLRKEDEGKEDGGLGAWRFGFGSRGLGLELGAGAWGNNANFRQNWSVSRIRDLRLASSVNRDYSQTALMRHPAAAWGKAARCRYYLRVCERIGLRIPPTKGQGSVPNNLEPASATITEPKRELPENPLPAENGKESSQGGSIMLVLSRKRGEMITIGNGVTVTVLAVQGDRVKLGVVAPAEVPVHRQEIRERIGGCSPVLEYAACS